MLTGHPTMARKALRAALLCAAVWGLASTAWAECSSADPGCSDCVCATDFACCGGAWDPTCQSYCQVDCALACGGGCIPFCEGKTCGDDGCGGSCGTCPTGQTCDANSGTCLCTPKCDGKTCGDDGCGGSCGACTLDKVCDGGSCTAPAANLQCGLVSSWGAAGAGAGLSPATLATVVQVAVGGASMAAVQADGTVQCWGKEDGGWLAGCKNLTNIQQVALGIKHGIALRRDGTIALWGDNSAGQTSVPVALQGATNVVAVAAGRYHNLVLRKDGSVVGWGSVFDAGGKVGTQAGPYKAIATSPSDSAAVRADGSVEVWSSNPALKAVPGGLVAARLALAEEHAVAVKPDGTVVSWGNDYFNETKVPANLKDVVAVATTSLASFAVVADGTVVAWGKDGNDKLVSSVSSAVGASSIACGYDACVIVHCSSACGAIAANGCCNGGVLHSCDASKKTKATQTCGNGCGWNANQTSFACGGSDTAPPVTTPVSCGGACQPACGGKQCGDDGCGGSCGTCGSGKTCDGKTGQCVCVPQCDGKQCGDDGCGGSCGTCPGSGTCQASTGQCLCTKQCTGKQCGDDGCGGSCGSCAANELCDTQTSTCQCVPDCTGKQCGGDGCGGSCGSCGFGKTCQETTGQCACVPSCSGKSCGGDGCGGSCGTCADGSFCTASGTCAGPASTSCNTVAAFGAELVTKVPAGIDGIAQIASGSGSFAALRHDGTITGWGAITDGWLGSMAGKSGIAAIAIGAKHAIALLKDGTVTVWGGKGSPLASLALPSGIVEPVAVAAGRFHSVVLQKNGTVRAFGIPSAVGAKADGATGVKAIAAGGDNTALILVDGSVKVFSAYADLSSVPAGLKATQVVIGQQHALALRPDGTVVAWGTTTTGSTTVPAGLNHVVQVALTGSASFALRDDGTITAWGTDTYGEIAGSKALTGVNSLRCDVFGCVVMTCAQACGGVGPAGCCDGDTLRYCSSSGKVEIPCGPGSCGWSSAKTAYACGTSGGSAPNFTPLRSCGGACTPNCSGRTCGDDGCGGSCGSCGKGQLCTADGLCEQQACGVLGAFGNTTTTSADVPTNLTNVRTVVGSPGFGVVAQMNDGTIASWPAGPQSVLKSLAGKKLRSIAVGGYHAVWADADGKVGVAKYTASKLTTPPSDLGEAVAVAAGSHHAVVLDTTGKVRVFGTGSAAGADGKTNVKAIAANFDATGIIHTDGSVEVFTQWVQMAKVPAGLKARQLALGYQYAYALTEEGTIVTWGIDQSGNGSPVPAGLKNMVAVAAGSDFGAAVGADGLVTSWGSWAGVNAEVKGVSALFCTGFGKDGFCVTVGCSEACGSLAPVGCCDGDLLRRCENGKPTATTCAAGTCGWSASSSAFACATDGAGAPGSSPLQFCGCLPKCDGKTCGDDGCGGSCGSCSGGQVCTSQGVCETAACSSVTLVGTPPTALSSLPAAKQTQLPPKSLQKVRRVFGGDPYYATLDDEGRVTIWPKPAKPPAWMAQVEAQTQIVDVGMGVAHAVLLTKAGEVKTFGAASATDFTVPAAVAAQGAIDVGAGENFSVALLKDGTIHAWGLSSYGGAATGSGFASFEAAFGTTIAIRPDGSLQVWSAISGIKSVPAGLKARQVAIGGAHALAVTTEGKVVAWGNNSYGQTNVPDGLDAVVRVAATDYASFAVRSNGTVVKWGDPGNTNLGKQIDALLGVSDLHCGGYHCAAVHCADECGALDTVGCCVSTKQGDAAWRCGSKQTKEMSVCETGTCGWNGSFYQCGASKQAVPNAMTPSPCGALCQANCAGRVCGFDGCSGSCGTCKKGTRCDTAGQCVPCTPKCDGKTCGDDQCGGSCGTCASGQACGSDQKCVDTTGCNGLPLAGCCAGKSLLRCLKPSSTSVAKPWIQACSDACGWDASAEAYGCVGLDEASADPSGTWPQACACVPNCNGKACGSDGCGGSCGACSGGKVCDLDSGTCATAQTNCVGVSKAGKCINDGNSVQYCAQNNQVTEKCADATVCSWADAISGYACGTSGSGDPKGVSLKSGGTGNGKCTPNCQGRQCGSDGCGGSCGSCSGGEGCHISLGFCTSARCAGRCQGEVKNAPPAGACGCDAGCTQRGDCCVDYAAVCSDKPQTPAIGDCGNGACEATKGETCASCQSDCGACDLQLSGAPPIRLPYREAVMAPGTAAQRTVIIAPPLDDVRVGPSPLPRDGLLAWLPQPGVQAGWPGVLLREKAGAGGKTATTVAAKVGDGFSYLADGQPTGATTRVLLPRPLPSAPYVGRADGGGSTIAFWMRTPAPTAGTTTPEPVMHLRGVQPGSLFDGELCAWPRKLETSVRLRCTNPYPALSYQPKIVSIRAYWGTLAEPLPPTPGSCADYDAKVHPNYACSDAAIQQVAESSCLGFENCEIAVPTNDPCGGAGGNKGLVVRAVCSYVDPTGSGEVQVVAGATTSDPPRLKVAGTTLDAAVVADTWTHVALSFQPHPGQSRAGVRKLYVNGEVRSQDIDSYQTAGDELVLGAGVATSGSAAAGSRAALDEVFVYDHALSGSEIRALRDGANAGVRMVWPPVATRRWASEGPVGAGNTGPVPVAPPKSAQVSARGNALEAQDAAIYAQASPIALQQPNAALGALTTWTLGAWIRVDAFKKDGAVLELLGKGQALLSVEASADCGGDGMQLRVGSATSSSPSCDHGLRRGDWAYVVVTQQGKLLTLSIDGHRHASLVLSAATPIFANLAANDLRGLRLQTGVALAWAGFWDRALGTDESLHNRSRGPDVWLDGGTYAAQGVRTLRDRAAFGNRRNAADADAPQLLTTTGATVAATGGKAGPLTLSSGTGAAGVVVVPARGRLAALTPGVGGTRGFSIALSTWTSLTKEQVTPLVQLLDPAQSAVLFSASLRCFVQTGTPLRMRCRLEGTRRAADGTNKAWMSSEGAGQWNASGAATPVLVAFSYDGANLHAALAAGPAQGSGANPIAPAVLSVTETAGAAPAYVALATPTATRHFRFGAPGQSNLELTDLRIYAQAFDNAELDALVSRTCNSETCGEGQSCVLGAAGALPGCSACQAGYVPADGAATGSCWAKQAFLQPCLVDSQCASGVCNLGRCAEPVSNATCQTTCGALGRKCEKQLTGYGTYTYGCSACRTYFLEPEAGNKDVSRACIWKPTTKPGSRCQTDDECLQTGVCATQIDVTYQVQTQWSPTCTNGGCPGWYNTSKNNQPFACDGKYVEQLDEGAVCPAVPSGSFSSTTAGKRCAFPSAQACTDGHMIPSAVHKGGKTTYTCFKCNTDVLSNEAGQPILDGDGKQQPLWVLRWSWMSPQMCKTVLESHIRARIGQDWARWPLLYNLDLPTLAIAVLNKQKTKAGGSSGDWLPPSVSAKEIAQLTAKGLGPDLLELMLDSAKAEEWYKLYPGLGFGDCSANFFGSEPHPNRVTTFQRSWYDQLLGYVVTEAPRPSPFLDPNVNRMVCAPNQFPNGTTCPPDPSIKQSLADDFCQSGFCARDSARCEDGNGFFEDNHPADRNDDRKSDDGGDAIALTQTQTTVANVQGELDAKQAAGNPNYTRKRHYRVGLDVAQVLTLWNTQLKLLGMSELVTGAIDDEKIQHQPTVTVLGISLPTTSSPGTNCAGPTFVEGQYVKPATPCKVNKPGPEVLVPKLKLCYPVPGGCKPPDPAPPVANGVQKGARCFQKTTVIGFIPVVMKAELTIDLCVSSGVVINSSTYEPSMEVVPSVGLGLDVRAGPGVSAGPITAFIGVRGAITVVELAFPIRWILTIAQVQNAAKKVMANMFDVTAHRDVYVELTILKLAVGIVAEVGLGPFSAEWTYDLFTWDGWKFAWTLVSDPSFRQKIDFQHRSAQFAPK